MIDKPERIWACEQDEPHETWWWPTPSRGGVEYVRADVFAKELARLAIESKDRDIALARLEGEVNALRKLCAGKACNHAWDREWRDDRTGRIYRNCVICGVKVEMP